MSVLVRPFPNTSIRTSHYFLTGSRPVCFHGAWCGKVLAKSACTGSASLKSALPSLTTCQNQEIWKKMINLGTDTLDITEPISHIQFCWDQTQFDRGLRIKLVMKPSFSYPDTTIWSHPNIDMESVPFQGRYRKGQGWDENAPMT